LSGVQRFASEIVSAIDDTLATAPQAFPVRVEIHVPPNCGDVRPFQAIALKRTGRFRGHAWEQFDLVRAARGAHLLSLGNTGPILHPRHVVVIHDAAVLAHPENFTFAFRNWYRLLFDIFSRFAHLATVSEFSASELCRYLSLKRESLRVIPNGADHLVPVAPDESILTTHRLTRGAYVLAIANASKTKNTAIVSAALDLLPPPRPSLVLVGARTDRIFQDAGSTATGAVHVLGGLSDAELKALYQNALCFVFPSLYEGFGLPPVEAMSCNCPVIASDIGALREVCQNAALFFDPRSPIDLAEKIGRIRQDPALVEEHVRLGAGRAHTYKWRESAERLLTLVCEV
jgi:glycosyltransferase involved in cell wall biosynthesis